MELRKIGIVRSGIKARKGVPRLGAPARIEILPEFAAGLFRIEKHSHLWVLAWLDEAERDLLQVIPRSLDDAPENLHGVFAVRSPVRPNPIGLTLVRALRIDGATIECDRLDFKDGTPVVDLKPYFLSRDMVFAATNEQIGRPMDRNALRESLLMQAVNFTGQSSAELERAVDILTDFRAGLLGMIEPKGLTVTAPAGRPEMADAFMGMTRVRLGAGTLRLGEPGVVRLEAEGASAEYELLDDGWRLRTATPPPVLADSSRR
ncbi:MAG: tRNA (N6-threonylcarbamoyladenosine(37)-N6)-methyltransferase TrmO [Bryobacteraceae bacterium]|nr:tRNA (N6-threonylcarbamoyladenosine(37)-N6)-methyltransferase TrmO [Bryobacteraceae bacterium]